MAPLQFEAPLQAIKARAFPTVLSELIKHMLLDNPHRTTVTTQPDPELGSRHRRPKEIPPTGGSTGPARDRLTSSPNEGGDVSPLKQRQEYARHARGTGDRADAAALRPGPEDQDHPDPCGRVGGAKVLSHDLFTGGIVYLDLGFDLHGLPQELLPLAPLFGRSLLQLGTEQEDFVQLTQRIGQKTGGIGPQTFHSTVRGQSEAASWLFLRGKATVAQTADLLGILRDIVLTARLDNRERFRQMALEERARLEASLVPGGSSYVAQRLGGALHGGGMGQRTDGRRRLLVFPARSRGTDVRHGLAGGAVADLEQIRQTVLHRGALIGNVDPGRRELGATSGPRWPTSSADLPARPSRQAQWTWQPATTRTRA